MDSKHGAIGAWGAVAAMSSPGSRPAASFDREMAQSSILPGMIARLARVLQLWLAGLV